MRVPASYQGLWGLRTTHDVIVCDAGTANGQPLARDALYPVMDSLLLVTTLALPSLQSTTQALRILTTPTSQHGLGADREKVGIVANGTWDDIGVDRDHLLRAACLHGPEPDQVVRFPIIGSIPFVPADVLRAINRGLLPRLLDHPDLAAPYHALATNVLPHLTLQPLAQNRLPAVGRRWWNPFTPKSPR